MTRPILVVDDEPFNVDLLIQELEDLGHVAPPLKSISEAPSSSWPCDTCKSDDEILDYIAQ